MIFSELCLRTTPVAGLLTENSPFQSTFSNRSHSSRGNSSIVTRCAIVFTPALLTTTSNRPKPRTVSSMTAATCLFKSTFIVVVSRCERGKGMVAVGPSYK